MSVRRISLCSFRSSTSTRGLKSVISAATATGKPVGSHCCMGPFALAIIAAQLSAAGPAFHDLGVAQHHATVRSAEAEGIGERHPHALLPGSPNDKVQIAVGIGVLQVGVDRDFTV